MTAATPIFRGYLADTDVRWNTIVQSVDDRKPEERPENPSSKNTEKKHFVIEKSRYDSIDSYLSEASKARNYSDIPLVMDEDVLKTLISNGIDELLARHIAHLFIRDPLVIYREKLTMDNKTHSDHFEVFISCVKNSRIFNPQTGKLFDSNPLPLDPI
jgi:glutamate--cysteine ligase catalytic subunit